MVLSRQLGQLIAAISGLVIGLSGFINLPMVKIASQELLNWGVVLGAFALGLGFANMLKIHGMKMFRGSGSERAFSLILVGSMLVMVVVGLVQGIQSANYKFLYNSFLVPLDSTIFSLIAFYIASAAYRAFVARNIDAAILLVTAVIVMLGRAPVGELIWSGFPPVTDWILNVPNTAGQRGIMIGAALGAIALSLRILLGIERSYLGRG